MSNNLQSKLKPYIDQLDAELHKSNKVTEILAQAEQMTGIKRLNIVLAGFVVLMLIFLFAFGSELMINVVAFVYPAYRLVILGKDHTN